MVRNLRFGIIGTNFISDWFCGALRRTRGVEVTAVYSRKDDTGALFAKKNGISRIFSDIDEFMMCEDIDAVYVASPTFLHYEHTMMALLYGKHVLCEKMIAVTHAQFSEMRSFAAERGLVLLEAMRPLFDPGLHKLRDIIGSLGTVRSASLEYLQYSSRYDKFKLGMVENAFNPKLFNSALSDIGIYPLSVAVYLFGMPTDITARSVFLENGFEGEGTATLKYGDVPVDVVYSKIRDGERPSRINFEDGYLTFDTIRAPREIRIYSDDGENSLAIDLSGENMHYEIEAFRSFVENGSDPFYLEHTDRVMRCVDKIYASAKITFPD